MDEDRLAAALRDATDDVVVPRDLVRGAERLGRARRARRRSAATALAVAAVVVAGGALVVPQIGAGGGQSASSTAGSGSSDSSAADASGSDRSGSEAAPESSSDGPTFQSRPQPDGEPGPAAESRGAGDENSPCDPPLVVAGAPARAGSATTVPAGQPLEITGPPLCGPLPPGSRYVLVLAPGSQAPAALAEVVPAEDGSFSVRVTLPPTTPPGAARLSVTGSPRPGYGADLDILPPDPDLQPAPTAEEPP